MTVTKNLGIWLDSSKAHLMECTTNCMETSTFVSKCMHPEKEPQQLLDYYNTLSEVIKNYDVVILFGFTDLQIDLLLFLIANNCLAHTKISIKYTCDMTNNQQIIFVRDYFSKIP